jgi:hypothetical protein
METKELIKIIIPLLGVAFGILIKVSKNQQYAVIKKYWLFFVIAGSLLFLFRVYKYLR